MESLKVKKGGTDEVKLFIDVESGGGYVRFAH